MTDDPLLGALIAKLPANGTAWSKADRVNWLRMFVMASNLAYGDAPGITVTDVEERAPLRFAPKPVSIEEVPAAAAEASAASSHVFVIDGDGFAMRDGMPINPEDIPSGAVIWDERRTAERGDLESVYWKAGGIRKPVPNHFKLEAA